MFFYPTIARAKRLQIICLSNGGYDGLGEQREKELQRAARRLGSSATCINNAALQDGPHAWDPSVVAANVGPWLHAGAVVVREFFDERAVDTVIFQRRAVGLVRIAQALDVLAHLARRGAGAHVGRRLS